MAVSERSEHESGSEAILAELPLLSRLPDAVRELVAESFVALDFEFGQTIIVEGEPPDGFYVLVSGLARVLRRGEDGSEVSLNVIRPGESFGEGGLLDGSPRTASVRASSAARVLRLDQAVFQALVRLHPEVRDAFALQPRLRRLRDFLRVDSTFSSLELPAVAEIAEAVVERTAAAGDVVVNQGDAGDCMYIVQDGKLRARIDGKDVRYLRTGDMFGELSLYTAAPRTATVEALTDATLLELGQGAFQRLLEHQPEFRARVEERIALYDAGAGAGVPLDFAELLPADATESANIGRLEPQPEVGRGVQLSELEAAAGERAVSRRGRFPLVRQLDEMDCGAAAVAMVCRHFGREVSVSRIREAIGTGVDGASLRGIQRGGEHVGLQVKAVKASKDRVEDLPLPAILHWGGNHWVVLYSLRGDRAQIADPARGRRRVGREELTENWSGYAAIPSPTPQLAQAPLSGVDAGWLRDHIRPHRRALAIGFVLALAVAGLEMLFPVLTQQIVDHVISAHDYTRLHLLAAAMVGVLGLSLAASMVQRRVLSRAAVQIDISSLDYMSGRLFDLPMAYFESRRTADIERRLDGARQIRELIVQQGTVALGALTQLLAALTVMFVYSWKLAALFVATTPIYAALMRYSAHRMRPTFESLEEEYARFASRQNDGIRGIATVKAMGAEDRLRSILVENLQILGRRLYRSDLTMMAYEGVVQVVTFLIVVLFLWLGALEVLAGNLTIGELVAFNALILLANTPLIVLLRLWDQWQLSRVLLERLQDIFDSAPEQHQEQGGLRGVPTLEGRVTIRGLGFRYPLAPSVKVLEEITLDVAPGTTVALVGRSGSGKSTLVKCVAGLLQASAGTIAFDGVRLDDLRYRELRHKIGYVLQEPYLFDDTIARNIAFGEEHVDPDRVRWAAEIADTHEFIERLPLAYETHVGDSGMRLSGGQAQRIAIARALYNSPPVLIFDEATSALDTESERNVKLNLDRMLEGRTAFIIAHRLSTVRDADLICVLDRGRLVERGSHEQLMRRQGLYFHLWSQQLA